MRKDGLYLSCSDAVKYLLENGSPSYYSIAQKLTKAGYKAQPIQISNYHKGHNNMRDKLATGFKQVFNIYIADIHTPIGRPSEW